MTSCLDSGLRDSFQMNFKIRARLRSSPRHPATLKSCIDLFGGQIYSTAQKKTRTRSRALKVSKQLNYKKIQFVIVEITSPVLGSFLRPGTGALPPGSG